MLNKITLATAVLIAGSVNGRRHLDDRETRGHKDAIEADDEYKLAVGEPETPLVQAQDCDAMCLFQDEQAKNSFCWKMQQPMMTAGWEWG